MTVRQADAQRARIAELEARLAESEDTLSAIRRGDFDAVVVETPNGDRQVYTLENADQPYRVLIEQIQEGALTLSADGAILYCNRRLAEMLDIRQEKLIGQLLSSFVVEPDRVRFDALLAAAREAPVRGEIALGTADDRTYPVNVSLSQLDRDETGPLICGVLTDLTNQKQHLRQLSDVNAKLQAEGLERERVEEALRQSQKMEAVGQLTGGLAHDFNNLLTGISGSLEMLEIRVKQARFSEVEKYIAMAQGASRRAAALTHRLLAFSRRQTLDPRPTDVARLVVDMADLIRRTVGPEITVETVNMTGLWTALVDPNQLENALLNLCINARDAMPDGGRITIETGNKWMDDRAARERDVPAGQYLSLCVSDSGTGMAADVIARAFDPFFTTKPLGLGTGLGLSMIYGFARQSNGSVRIYSEVGDGTMVCIYLPRHYGAEEVEEMPKGVAAIVQAEQGETVLVVDDEPSIRVLITDVLTDLGYASVEAQDGPTGLKVLQSDQRIDLLITDVGLPGGLNGRQVADAARALRPGLRVLFITGYAENAVVGEGRLDPGMSVLTKPFAVADLSAKIRMLIEMGRAAR